MCKEQCELLPVDHPDRKLSADCDAAWSAIGFTRLAARALHLPEPEIPDWLVYPICADAGLAK